MRQLKQLNKIIIFTLCLTLLPFVGMSQATTVSPFTDVPTSHWALPHIVKMEARGIISGYGNGIFKPESTVTQLEATTMAIRAMGLEDEAKKATNAHLYNSIYQLPTSWNAAGIVSVAIDKKIIDSDNFLPSTAASRAWVAQLIVRMMEAEDELPNVARTSFTDDSQIPTWAKNYVSLAADKGIVAGIATATGSLEFRPNTSVTRAQLATMISRCDKYMADVPGQMPMATVSSVSGQQINLQHQNGSTSSHFISSGAVLVDGNEKQISYQNLQAGNLIRYTTNASGLISFVEVVNQKDYNVPPVNQASTITGGVVQYYADNNILIIQEKDGRLHTYPVSSNAIIKDSQRNYAVSDLQVDDQVVITVKDDAITNIDITSKSTTGVTKGKIFALDLERGLVTLESNSRYTSYSISERVMVEYGGIRFPTVRDLRVGDEVEITLKDNMVDYIKLLNAYQKDELSGKIVAISASDYILTIRTTDGMLKAYEVSPRADITVQGISKPVLGDLQVDDSISFTTENNMVMEIAVTSRSFQNEVYGEVITIDTSRMLITIEDEDDNLAIYKIDDYVILDIDKRNPDLDDIRAGMKVTLKLDKNVVHEIAFTNTVEGVIEQFDKNRTFVTLSTDQGRTNYRIDGDVDIYFYSISRPDIDDLEVGHEIIATVEENIIKKIEVVETKTGQVTSVDVRRDRIVVKDGRREDTYRIYSDVKIIVPNMNRPTIDDINENDVVKLYFEGEELKEVTVIPPIYGLVTAVDQVRDRLIVQTMGKEEIFPINRSLTVYSPTGNEISATSLREYDYVQVVDIDNETAVYKTDEVRGELYSASSSQARIYFYDLNRRYRDYELAKNVTVWDGSTSRLLGDLTRGNNISMYLLNNEVVAVRMR